MNAAIDELMILLSKQADFMSKPMGDMSNKELQRYKMMRDRDIPKAIKGQPYVLLSELAHCKQCKQDTTGKAVFGVLRHLDRLLETPIKGSDRMYTVPAE